MTMVLLEELMAERVPSVDPAKFTDEKFELLSIPAFDAGAPEYLSGSEIGSFKKIVMPDDVLLARIVPHIRRSWVVPERSEHRQIASGEWIIFRSPRFYPPYLRHVLISDPFHVEFMQTVAGVGGSLLRARPEGVKKIRIPLPPLDEQKRIAGILDQADALRRLRARALEKLNTLGQAVFQEMFGDWDRNSPHRTEKLGNFLDFLTSGSRGWGQYYAETGAKFIRIQNVKNDEFNSEDIAFIEAPQSAEAERTRVTPGDVLLSITADLGRTAVIPEDIGEAYINQHLAILRTKKIKPDFLSAMLSSVAGQRRILKSNREGVKAGLNFSDIRNLEVIVPTDELQSAFIRRKATILQFIRFEQQAGLASLKLFSSLQSAAFQGKL